MTKSNQPNAKNGSNKLDQPSIQSSKEESNEQALFNSVTNSVSVENQNQNHNTKKQSLGPNTKR